MNGAEENLMYLDDLAAMKPTGGYRQRVSSFSWRGHTLLCGHRSLVSPHGVWLTRQYLCIPFNAVHIMLFSSVSRQTRKQCKTMQFKQRERRHLEEVGAAECDPGDPSLRSCETRRRLTVNSCLLLFENQLWRLYMRTVRTFSNNVALR